MINFNIDKTFLIYLGSCILGGSLLLLMYILGIKEGAQALKKEHDLELAEIRLNIEQYNQDLIDTQIKLTACKSQAAGDCALDCESITQERVSQALASCAAICRD